MVFGTKDGKIDTDKSNEEDLAIIQIKKTDHLNMEGLDKWYLEKSFDCILEYDNSNEDSSEIEGNHLEPKGFIKINGVINIENISATYESEDLEVSSEDEGFHELSVNIKRQDEELKPNLSENETFCSKNRCNNHFKIQILDEEEHKSEAKIPGKANAKKFNCTVEIESTGFELQTCGKMFEKQEAKVHMSEEPCKIQEPQKSGNKSCLSISKSAEQE